MKKIDLGQTISILANIGVIVGIVFLVIEVRQNNVLLIAESIGTVFQNRLDRHDRVMENPGYTAVMVKNDMGEPLSAEEREVVMASHDRGFIAWQREYLLYQLGVLPEEYLRANFGSMKMVIPSRVGTLSVFERWQQWKADANPAYRAFVEQCIFAECDEIPK